MHFVHLDEARCRLVRVVQEVFARGEEFGVDCARQEVHVPCGDGEGEEYALGGLVGYWGGWGESRYHCYPQVNGAVMQKPV